MVKNRIIYLLPTITLFHCLLEFFLGEDSLGGGKHDYFTHLKFLNGFTYDFYDTYNKFGIDEEFTKQKLTNFIYSLFFIFKSRFTK